MIDCDLRKFQLNNAKGIDKVYTEILDFKKRKESQVILRVSINSFYKSKIIVCMIDTYYISINCATLTTTKMIKDF